MLMRGIFYLHGQRLRLDVPLEILPEILQAAFERLHGAGRERAEGFAGTQEIGMHLQDLQIAHLTLPGVDRRQEPFHPGQSIPAGRAPAAGLLGEEMLEVVQQPDRAGPVIDDDHRARAEPAAGLLDRREIHRDVEMLLDEELGRGAARQKGAKRVAIAHAAGVLLENLADRRAHRQLPRARVLHPAAGAVDLGAAVFAVRQSAEPLGAAIDDVRARWQGSRRC